MPMLTPEQLQADAILPQCLDNQFVSEGVLQEMLSRGADYSDARVKERRKDDTHVEFLRSLLYSSQVVVNRAYFENSDYLRTAAAEEPEALSALIRKQAVIPFVFKKEEMTAPLPFTTVNHNGAAKLSELLGKDGTHLQFAEDEDRNQERLDELQTNFAGFFTGTLKLNCANDRVVRPMAQQLSAKVSDHAVLSQDVLARFQHLLEDSADYTYNTAGHLPEGKRFGRENIYKKYFIEEETKIADGRFRKELKDPALRMFKTLVDLKYNANLPDMLSRYTLTPASLPGRSALPFDRKGGSSDVGKVLNTLMEFKKAVMDHPPETLLPRLHGMKLDDVRAIRELPEWQEFSSHQQALLVARPEEMVACFEEFNRSLICFQKELGRWSPRKTDRAELIRRKGATSLKFVLTVGAVALTIVQNPEEAVWHAILDGAGAVGSLETLEHLIPDTFKDWGVKLMITVHDTVARELDTDYTHQLDIMRQSGNMRRNELIQLVQEIQESTEFHRLKETGSSEQGRC